MMRRDVEVDRQLRGTMPTHDNDLNTAWSVTHYAYAHGYKLKVTEKDGWYTAESPDLPAFRAHGDSMEQVREYAERMIPLVLVDRDQRLSCFASGGEIKPARLPLVGESTGEQVMRRIDWPGRIGIDMANLPDKTVVVTYQATNAEFSEAGLYLAEILEKVLRAQPGWLSGL